MTTDLATVDQGSATTEELTHRLGELKTQRGVVRQFFADVMVKGEDYGKIPGTQRATLLKPGAESLCEFYGLAIKVADVRETIDRETGFYRCVVVVALASKRHGGLVAEGVGEANTNESRYRWRWLFKSELPPGVDGSGLRQETREGRNGPYTRYRAENEDPWSLWNTILKMAKKRALIDATLSATRSSGLFTQDAEDLDHWIADDDEAETGAPGAQERPTAAERPAPGPMPAELGKARYDARAALSDLERGLKAANNVAGLDSARLHFSATYKTPGDGPLGVGIEKLSARQCGEIVEACARIAQAFSSAKVQGYAIGEGAASMVAESEAPEVVDETDRPLP